MTMTNPERNKLYFALGFLTVALIAVFLAFRPASPPVAAAKKGLSGRQSAFQMLNE